ncbi:MAG: tetratricopeptide repeat protein, partial [Candidatus Poribacteria bacterium]|nr:tetratricopeptide repeat protein [Candidatus Poribacteria bacterium]
KQLESAGEAGSFPYLMVASAYAEVGENDLAIATYDKFLIERPDDSNALSRLARLYTDLGRHEDAAQTLERAVQVNPNNLRRRIELSRAYVRLERVEDAVTLLNESLSPDSLERDRADVNLTLGDLYSSLKRHSEARAAYIEVIRLQPENARAHRGLGGAYLALGRRELALDEYKILLELDDVIAAELFNRIYAD